MHFKHSKQSIGEQVQTVYAIQTVGIDDDFRVSVSFPTKIQIHSKQMWKKISLVAQAVSQEEYFEHLAQSKIYASNQVFLFEGNHKNELASSNFDLRSHLEMFLMGLSQRNNDYGEIEHKKDVLFEQKKIHAWSKRELDKFDKDFQLAADVRDENEVAVIFSIHSMI